MAWDEPPAGLPAALRDEVDRLSATASSNGGLTPAYQRLFVGPARPGVYPYESCYRDPNRRLAGPWAERVAARYTAEGLACPGLLPDHIAAELAFMAHLAAREAEAEDSWEEDAARQYRAQQAAFLRQHLLIWGPEFCRQLQAATDHPFYTAVAQTLLAWLELEAEHFELRGAAEATPAYPATVVARLCTLCGVCAEACPTQALRLTWTDWEARLSIEWAECTSCRLCAEVCPFKALKLADAPATGVLARSSLLPCPDCGRPALPHAFWQRLRRGLEPGDPAAVAARRCPECTPPMSFGLSPADGGETCAGPSLLS